VFQARKNEMASGKKKMDLLKPVPPEMDQEKEVLLAERMYQAPLTKPLPSTHTSPIHAPAPQFKFVAPIESKVNVSSNINCVLSEKVYLSVEELLALPTEAQATQQHTWYLLTQWTWTTNILQLNQHYCFR